MKKQTKLFTTLSAAALLTIGVSAVSMAAGWDNSTGVWKYLDNDGTEVTDTWKSANGNWFYLDSNGEMATNQLIEDNNNSKTRYYYVDQYGAMVTNTWKAVAMDGSNDDLDAEYWWYYFGSDGKAYTSEADLTSSKIKTINGLKYAFNDEGHMLYGWIAKDNLDQQDGDSSAWKTSTYYFNGWNDGHMQTGWIQLSVDDDDDTENYWFYFKSDGQKQIKRKKINGYYYHFDGDDGHMLTDWSVATQSVEDAGGASASELKYLNKDGAERKNKWVWAVPDEDYLKDYYDDDEYRWWYFNKSGSLVTNQIKKINGKKYAFDEYGRMLKGFVKATSSSTTGIVDLKNPDDWTKAQIISGTLDSDHTISGNFYYFSSDEEKDGSMKKGYQNLELDDGTYQFYFNTQNGQAQDGYVSKIKKYCINGLVLAPTSDDDSNYGGVIIDVVSSGSSTKEDPQAIVFGDDMKGYVAATVDGSNYVKLVNKSGTVVKKKAKVKDNNDAYYVVNSNGHVIAYAPDEDAYNDCLTIKYKTSSTGEEKEKKFSISSDMLSCATVAALDAAIDDAVDDFYDDNPSYISASGRKEFADLLG